jgi:hypothetical protein
MVVMMKVVVAVEVEVEVDVQMEYWRRMAIYDSQAAPSAAATAMLRNYPPTAH